MDRLDPSRRPTRVFWLLLLLGRRRVYPAISLLAALMPISVVWVGEKGGGLLVGRFSSKLTSYCAKGNKNPWGKKRVSICTAKAREAAGQGEGGG